MVASRLAIARFRHSDQDPALSFVGGTPVGDGHVVDEEYIVALPWKAVGLRGYRGADRFGPWRGYGRSIAEAGVVREFISTAGLD